MTSIKRYTHLVILRGIHPRILVPPTHFQENSKKNKVGFSWNRTKIFISPESAWITESVPIFLNKKIAHTKKLCRFQIPEFNLAMPLLLMTLLTDHSTLFVQVLHQVFQHLSKWTSNPKPSLTMHNFLLLFYQFFHPYNGKNRKYLAWMTLLFRGRISTVEVFTLFRFIQS